MQETRNKKQETLSIIITLLVIVVSIIITPLVNIKCSVRDELNQLVAQNGTTDPYFDSGIKAWGIGYMGKYAVEDSKWAIENGYATEYFYNAVVEAGLYNPSGATPTQSTTSSESTSHTHKYTDEVTKQPTCIEEGELVSKCSCGDTKTQVLPALGHDYQFVETVDAKCGIEGYEEYKCSRCEDVKREVIPALEHKWELENKTDATCIEDGKITYKCSLCNETKEEIVKAKGHTPSEWQITKEAGFFTNGEKQIVCTVCGEVIETEIIPAKQDYRIWLGCLAGVVVISVVTVVLIKKKKNK